MNHESEDEEEGKYKNMYWSLYNKSKDSLKDQEIMELKRRLAVYESKIFYGVICGVNNGDTIGFIKTPEFKDRDISFHKTNSRGFVLKTHSCIGKDVKFRLDFTHGKYQAINVCLKDDLSGDQGSYDILDDFIDNPKIFDNNEWYSGSDSDKDGIDDKDGKGDIFQNSDVWYMNGYNTDYKDGVLGIWDILVSHGFVHSFINYNTSVNINIIEKLKIGDKIAWYFPGKGYVAILEVEKSATIMDDDTLHLISPSFSQENETASGAVTRMKEGFEKDNWDFIKIPVKFLAMVDKHKCVDEYSFNWKGTGKEWVKGKRSAHAQKPSSDYWKEQVSEIYNYML